MLTAMLLFATLSDPATFPTDPVLESAGAYVLHGWVQPLDTDPDEETPGPLVGPDAWALDASLDPDPCDH